MLFPLVCPQFFLQLRHVGLHAAVIDQQHYDGKQEHEADGHQDEQRSLNLQIVNKRRGRSRVSSNVYGVTLLYTLTICTVHM